MDMVIEKDIHRIEGNPLGNHRPLTISEQSELRRYRNNLQTTGREHDSQQSKLYAAEDSAGISWANKPFLSYEHAQEYLNGFLRQKWFLEAFPWVRVLFVKRAKTNARHGWCTPGGTIFLPPDLLVKWYLIHELVHAVTPAIAGAWHGRMFCRNYLLIAEKVYGKHIRLLLQATFDKHNIKYKIRPNRAPLSTERLADLQTRGYDLLRAKADKQQAARKQQCSETTALKKPTIPMDHLWT